MRRRVVITGMGAVTPLGTSVDKMFGALLEGKSGVTTTKRFEAGGFPTQIAAQVLDYDLSPYVRDPGVWEPSGVNTQFALGAAYQALSDAGLLNNSQVDRTRMGVYLGSGEGIQDFPNLIQSIAKAYNREKRALSIPTFIQGAMKSLDAAKESEQELHTTAAHLANEYDLGGPNFTCLTACAASSQAVGEGTAIIRHNDAEIILAGGSHSMIHPLGVTGFNRLTALSTMNAEPAKASKPFDLRRDGFVMGEGSGMVVLEEYEHARRRGARIYAELSGYGTTADAFRLTDSCEDGRGAIACIDLALKDSGMSPDAIGYINAHGTSTQVNDHVETLAIKKVFGEQAYRVPVSSSKSMLGHLIAAAGAVELIICVMALQKNVLPPTINYEVPDPDCDLDYIPNVAREKRVDHVLSNSFGFGGQNVSLVVSRLLD